MRFAAILCACAVFLVTGCAATHWTAHLTAEQQWEALCRRMPQRQVLVASGEAYRSSLTREQETTLKRIALVALDSVVQIKSASPVQEESRNDFSNVHAISSRSGGTGIVISSDGLILTNEHVVRHTRGISVVFSDGREYPVVAMVVHPRLDIAVLQIDRSHIACVSPSLEPVQSGTPVVAITCATDQRQHCYRTGVVTSGRRSLQRELDPAGRRDYGDLVETTVKLEPGFSGGPLLNSEGHVVGLNVAVMGSPGTDQHRGYAIPFDDKMNKAIGQLVALAKATSVSP